MNILLINLELKANTGGILQLYALQNLLESWGHNVVKAEKTQNHEFHFSFSQLSLLVKRIVKRYILKQNIELLPEIAADTANFLPRKHATTFIKKYIHIIEIDKLSKLDGSKYDAVIVGSDQVWRKLYAYGLLTDISKADNAFLSFSNNWDCLRIAYAASFGIDNWEYTDEETEELKKLICRFNAISVREDSAIKLIHNNLNDKLNIEHVLDPTMLIPKDVYLKLVTQAKTVPSKGTLLLYILDQTDKKERFINNLISQKGFVPFYVNNPKYEDESYSPKERIQEPIEQWLRGFMEAEFVIADSFHACVFSIIFEKPFLVLKNPKRGNTRIESLMRMFGLSDRIVDAEDLTIDICNLPDINWNDIATRKILLREKSIQFLKEALRSNDK